MQHNLKAVPQRKMAYFVTVAEFEKYFGEYTTKSFDILPHPHGQSWYLISTGETFTVLADDNYIEKLVAEHKERANLVKNSRIDKKAK